MKARSKRLVALFATLAMTVSLLAADLPNRPAVIRQRALLKQSRLQNRRQQRIRMRQIPAKKRQIPAQHQVM